MAQTPSALLNTDFLDADLPEDLAFVLPEEPETAADELALEEFLREFETQDEPRRIVCIFPVDEDR